jgi:hypothetical protein
MASDIEVLRRVELVPIPPGHEVLDEISQLGHGDVGVGHGWSLGRG